jgi:hypothetical protein
MKSTLVCNLGYTVKKGPPPAWLKDHREAERATIFRPYPRPSQKESRHAPSPH